MINKLREPINSITHLAGAILSFIALIAMLSKVVLTDPNFTSIISVTIFGICLILLYTVSGTFNFFKKFNWIAYAFNYVYYCNNWYSI